MGCCISSDKKRKALSALLHEPPLQIPLKTGIVQWKYLLETELLNKFYKASETTNGRKKQVLAKFPGEIENAYNQRRLLDLVSKSSIGCDFMQEPNSSIAEKVMLPSPDPFLDEYYYDINCVLQNAGTIEPRMASRYWNEENCWHLFGHEVWKYAEGSFFSEQLEPRRTNSIRPGCDHCGTVLIFTPSLDCVGGRLVVNGTSVGKDDANPLIAYIPLCIPYEVTPLKTGTLIVAKAAVSKIFILWGPHSPAHEHSRTYRTVADRTLNALDAGKIVIV